MSSTEPPALLPPAWTRAVRLATRAPQPAEAVSALLAELVPAVGARAGAVLDVRGESVRDVWGLTPDEIGSLRVEGAVDAALQRRHEWADGVLRLPRAEQPGDGGELLLAPLHARGTALGVLLLLFSPDAAAPAGVEPSIQALADLIASALDRERLHEEALEAVQTRSHFLTALNHELRTPATALALSAEMLRSGADAPLPPHLARVLRDVETHLHTLGLVLRRLVDLGELEDQATPQHRDLLDLRRTVADLLRRVEPAAQRKGLSLALYVPRHLPALQTDRVRFARALLYLLSNAIHYTSHGRVEVRLERATRRTGETRREPILRVLVVDTGRGIPQAELERVLEPFAQVGEGARTSSPDRGAGLGLSLARQLVRSLGGDLTLESTPGRGTTATLVLPYRSPEIG